MLKRMMLASCFLGFGMSQTLAQTACPLTYETFEFAIPHLDLEQCPADLARAGAFCRVTTANDAVHVFLFEEKGKQCLLAVKSYAEYQITVK